MSVQRRWLKGSQNGEKKAGQCGALEAKWRKRIFRTGSGQLCSVLLIGEEKISGVDTADEQEQCHWWAEAKPQLEWME